MRLDEWELLDCCHGDGEKKFNTDFDFRSVSVSDQQHKICHEQDIGAVDDEDAVSQVSGKKLIGDMKKFCSAELSVDRKTDFDLRSISVSDQQRTIRDEREIGAQDDEDADSQVSSEKLIGGDMKNESARFCTGGKSVEKRQKLGIAAICSFGIAVAATICSAAGKP